MGTKKFIHIHILNDFLINFKFWIYFNPVFVIYFFLNTLTIYFHDRFWWMFQFDWLSNLLQFLLTLVAAYTYILVLYVSDVKIQTYIFIYWIQMCWSNDCKVTFNFCVYKIMREKKSFKNDSDKMLIFFRL